MTAQLLPSTYFDVIYGDHLRFRVFLCKTALNFTVFLLADNCFTEILSISGLFLCKIVLIVVVFLLLKSHFTEITLISGAFLCKSTLSQ